MSYLVLTDITDNVIKSFGAVVLQGYFDEADEECTDLAEKSGLTSGDIEDTPLHFKLKRYLIAYVCMRVCEDYLGTNNVETPDIEKYAIKYDIYKKRVMELRSEVTPEVISGTVDEQSDRAGMKTGYIYRG